VPKDPYRVPSIFLKKTLSLTQTSSVADWSASRLEGCWFGKM